MSLPNRASDALLRQVLAAQFKDSTIRESTDGVEEIVHAKAECGLLTVPGGTCLSVVADRFPVLADLLKGRRSTLVKILEDREDETVMVMDSILSGGKALFLARLLNEPAAVRHWMDCQQWPRMQTTLQPIDHERVLIVSSLESFVLRSSEAES